MPVEELEKLEQSRLALYKHLNTLLTKEQMYKLPYFTQQIWKVANTRSWEMQIK